VKLLNWQPCASPSFGITTEEYKENENICNKKPIGISKYGKYSMDGTYIVECGVLYTVTVDRI
jgi:hypothetical protein